MGSKKFVLAVLFFLTLAAPAGAQIIGGERTPVAPGITPGGVRPGPEVNVSAPAGALRSLLSIQDYRAESGEILIPVMLSTNDRIGSLQFRISWDKLVLLPMGVASGSLAAGSLFDSDTDLGLLNPLRTRSYAKVGIVSTDGLRGNGSVAGIRFNITRITGRNYTSLLIDEVIANRAGTFEPISIDLRSGNFTVGGRLGDCDGNGRIQSADALLALRMSVGRVPANPGNCDMVGDGRVTAVDAARILEMALRPGRVEVR